MNAFTKQNLLALEAQFVDVKALNHDPQVVDTALLEATVKEINSCFAQLYKLNLADTIQHSKGIEMKPIMDFLVEKGVIHSWVLGVSEMPHFKFREGDKTLNDTFGLQWTDLAAIQQERARA